MTRWQGHHAIIPHNRRAARHICTVTALPAILCATSVPALDKAGLLVYVDGKPSPMTDTEALQVIPAASIKDIEVRTTLPAKYETDGDVGIINIVTRKATPVDDYTTGGQRPTAHGNTCCARLG